MEIDNTDASGNATVTDASGNAIVRDSSGNATVTDASGNAIVRDASGVSVGTSQSRRDRFYTIFSNMVDRELQRQEDEDLEHAILESLRN